jgi:hypothetical protein
MGGGLGARAARATSGSSARRVRGFTDRINKVIVAPALCHLRRLPSSSNSLTAHPRSTRTRVRFHEELRELNVLRREFWMILE